jgi:hypothetical protein
MYIIYQIYSVLKQYSNLQIIYEILYADKLGWSEVNLQIKTNISSAQSY